MHSHVRAYTRRHQDLRTLVEARRLDVKAARVLLANGLETLLTLPSILYAVVCGERHWDRVDRTCRIFYAERNGDTNRDKQTRVAFASS